MDTEGRRERRRERKREIDIKTKSKCLPPPPAPAVAEGCRGSSPLGRGRCAVPPFLTSLWKASPDCLGFVMLMGSI